MREWIAVSGALIAAGVALFLYKVLVLGYPLSTAEAPGTWRVDVVVAATGDGSRAVIDIPLPRSSGYQHIVSEEVQSEATRFSINEADGDRRGKWSGRLEGSTSLSYQVTIEAETYGRSDIPADAGGKYPASVASYLEASTGIQHSDPAVAELRKELALDTKNKTALAFGIYDFVAKEIGAGRGSAPTDALLVIKEGRGTPRGRARLFCALARANGLPCRVMTGIPLRAGRSEEFAYWNEVYLAGAWVPFDVIERRAGLLPPDRLSLGPSDGSEPVKAANISGLT
ncbi:MAG TPA: transglutaminase domain-containing protein, partial [Rhizomicrobium sp.]